jgi:hypothetical protein
VTASSTADGAGSPKDFAERDDAANAIRELIQVGLAHRIGGFVFPTLAAVSVLD